MLEKNPLTGFWSENLLKVTPWKSEKKRWEDNINIGITKIGW
jgi:hypothetical protein